MAEVANNQEAVEIVAGQLNVAAAQDGAPNPLKRFGIGVLAAGAVSIGGTLLGEQVNLITFDAEASELRVDKAELSHDLAKSRLETKLARLPSPACEQVMKGFLGTEDASASDESILRDIFIKVDPDKRVCGDKKDVVLDRISTIRKADGEADAAKKKLTKVEDEEEGALPIRLPQAALLGLAVLIGGGGGGYGFKKGKEKESAVVQNNVAVQAQQLVPELDEAAAVTVSRQVMATNDELPNPC